MAVKQKNYDAEMKRIMEAIARLDAKVDAGINQAPKTLTRIEVPNVEEVERNLEVQRENDRRRRLQSQMFAEAMQEDKPWVSESEKPKKRGFFKKMLGIGKGQEEERDYEEIKRGIYNDPEDMGRDRSDGNIKNYPDKVEIKGIPYIREDVHNNPREITEKFLERRKKRSIVDPRRWVGYKYGPMEKFEPKGNLLFLMDNENGIKIYDNVKAGIFRTKENEGTDNEKENYLVLKPNKLRVIKWEDYDERTDEIKEDMWRAWIHEVNSVTSYPVEPMYDTEEVGQAIRKAVADRKAFDEGQKKGRFGNWLFWIAVALGVGYGIYLVGFKWGVFESLGIIKHAVAPAVQQVVNNSTQSGVTIVPGGTVG